MAHAPAPRLCPVYQLPNLLKRTLQLLAGSPCQRLCSTRPSSGHSSLPSNLQSLPHNRMARMLSRPWRIHHPGLGNPCHEFCNTTPSLPRTSQPANSQSHHCNYTDLLAEQLALAQALALA